MGVGTMVGTGECGEALSSSLGRLALWNEVADFLAESVNRERGVCPHRAGRFRLKGTVSPPFLPINPVFHVLEFIDRG